MRVGRMGLAALLLLTLALSGRALAWSDWQTLKTDHFTVFYRPGLEKAAEDVLRKLEARRPALEELTGNELLNFPVVVEDTGYTNGFANPIYPSIHLYATPPAPSSSLGATEDWWELVGVHEYTHALSLTKTEGKARAFKALYGTMFSPNAYSPGWVSEGMTVYSESRLSPYAGRLNDGYFDAYLGASVRDGRLPSISEATDLSLAFPRDRHYLYGGEFFRYLAETYGEERFAAFFAVNGADLDAMYAWAYPARGLDRSARRVYGESFPALWSDWLAYEAERFKDWRMEGERLTRHGWEVETPVVVGGKLYYQRSWPESGGPRTYWGNRVVERDLATGAERPVVETTTQLVLPVRVRGHRLYYAASGIRPGFANASELGFGAVAVLHERDLASGSDRVLLIDGMRAYDVLPGGSILYARDRKDDFGSEIRLFDPATGENRLLGTKDYLVEEMVSDGTHLVFTAHRNGANASLYSFDLGTQELRPLVDTPWVEAFPALSGDRLFYAANEGRVWSIYAYDFSTGRSQRLTRQGFARAPAYDPRTGELYYVGLTSAGYDLYRKTEALARAEDVQRAGDGEGAPPPSVALAPSPSPSFAGLKVQRGDYRDDLRTLIPALHYPLVEQDEYGAYRVSGLVLAGADAVGDWSYRTSFLYDAARDSLEYSLALTTNYFAPVQAGFGVDNTGSDGTPEVTLEVAYPAYVGNEAGLKSVTLGVSTSYASGTRRLEAAPYVGTRFSWPWTIGSLIIQRPFTGGSAGLETDLALSRHALGGNLSLTAEYASDPASADPVLHRIRGYSDPLPGQTGETVSLEYSRTLHRFNLGLWSPRLFLEDTYATLFADGAYGRNPAYQASWGAELHLRGTVFTILPLDTYIRLVGTREGKSGVEFGVTAAAIAF